MHYGDHMEQTLQIPGQVSDTNVANHFAVHIVGKSPHATNGKKNPFAVDSTVELQTARFGLNAWAWLTATRQLTPVMIGEPFTTSELSGRPAYEYCSSDDFNGKKPERPLRLKLTLDEILRLGALTLKPEEFKKLYATHGIFFEIHDDFYDLTTGEAVQPKW